MLSVYPAIFFEDEENSGYEVSFPDLNHLATVGTSVDDAMYMAIDCLAGHLHWLKEDGDDIPVPSPIEKVDVEAYCKELDIEPGKYFVTLVSVDVEEYAKKHFDKSVKKTLTIPAWLNDAAKGQGINFSQTLQEALKAKLNIG